MCACSCSLSLRRDLRGPFRQCADRIESIGSFVFFFLSLLRGNSARGGRRAAVASLGAVAVLACFVRSFALGPDPIGWTEPKEKPVGVGGSVVVSFGSRRRTDGMPRAEGRRMDGRIYTDDAPAIVEDGGNARLVRRSVVSFARRRSRPKPRKPRNRSLPSSSALALTPGRARRIVGCGTSCRCRLLLLLLLSFPSLPPPSEAPPSPTRFSTGRPSRSSTRGVPSRSGPSGPSRARWKGR
mmetsp:Transcript_19785/g.46296  ORF Transcript_19785/g.46296 Transcript_19785/m.46296 type:complete len:240 (-) Transcript_19785:367-1086(-)